MIRAAGVLFLGPGRSALFLRRGNGSDHPGEWCFPGGQAEGDETAEEAAVRETMEEAAREVDPALLRYHTRGIARAEQPAVEEGAEPPAPSEDVDFTTFVTVVDEQFTPVLCDEHTGYAWASLDAPPEPLHPGCRLALDRLGMDELGVARAMAAGLLTSPQRYENITLWDMRVTGTGLAYRTAGGGEHVWRAPEIYMNEEFLARCNGLAVIWKHPKKAKLDSKEFADRVVGTVLLPYLRVEDEEVWAIAKVYDDEANEAIPRDGLSTSPAVVFRDQSVNTKMSMEDGTPLLIEGKPSLLDHLAICEQGVWDKGGEPRGITINDSNGGSIVADDKTEDKADAVADAAKQDAAEGSMMDAVMAKLDSICGRMDAMEEDRKADAARRDSSNKDEGEKKDADEGGKGKDEPKEVAADRKDNAEDLKESKEDSKKDGEDKDAKDDAARVDSVPRSEYDALAAQVRDLVRTRPKQRSDADYHAMADTQARGDTVFQAFGDSAPRPLDGEDNAAYRRRLAHGLKARSPRYKDVDVYALNDPATFDIIESGIYADAMTAASQPTDLREGELRERVSTDVTGRRISTFVGSPRDWLAPGGTNSRQLMGINKDAH